MAQPFISQITMFGGTFAPVNYAFCNGQLMAISQNQALFALIGTFYGGDGIQTFGLPNLQSQLPVHQGQGYGLSPYNVGQTGGTTSVALNQSTIPSHSHFFVASTASANSATVSGNVLPATPTVSGAALYANQGSPALETQTIAGLANAGGGLPHDNLMPSLCISFIISLFGVFPSRN
jgi:microcystin-dependent protein